MKRSFHMAALNTAALVLALVPLVASAKVMTPKTEPVSIFATGQAPSWAAVHTNSGTAEHVTYHKNAAAALEAWKVEHASEVGSSTYLTELRMALVKRDQAHRAYHHWNDDTAAEKSWRAAHEGMSNPFKVRAVMTVKTAAELLAEGNYSPIVPEHRYEGNRPSSRLLQEQAANRGLSAR